MRIKTTQEILTLRDMETIVLSHERDIARKKMLMDYYLGRHHIMGKADRSSGAPNNKLVSNYCEYITNMSTGFFLGQPVAYKAATENDEALNVLLDVLAYNDEQAHNLELAEEAKKFHPRVTAATSIEEAIELAYLLADKNSVILAFGSLSYLGRCMEIMEKSGTGFLK